MTNVKIAKTLAGAAAAGLLLCGTAGAQFSGLVQLPRDDFTWRWGNWERETRSRVEDFSVNGGEAGFRCELTGRLGPGSRMSTREIRQMEMDLSVSLYFIQAAASAMNILDRQLDLDWAELACLKPEGTDDPEATQERVDRAREKAVQEMLERRERRERRERD